MLGAFGAFGALGVADGAVVPKPVVAGGDILFDAVGLVFVPVFPKATNRPMITARTKSPPMIHPALPVVSLWARRRLRFGSS